MKLLISLSLIFATLNFGFAGESPESTASFVVHILGYIRKDYPGAVENGKVISAAEYQEQIDFVDSAIQTAKALPKISAEPQILAGLEKLRAKIISKESGKDIGAVTLEVEAKVIKVAGIEVAPLHWPNRLHGKALYAQNCTSCHGVKGLGDGPSGGNLDPKPANFHADSMNDTSPFQVFNAIRLGLPGTGMAAFSQFSDDEVWDLAFYVTSLRHEKAGNPSVLPNFSLTDVANRSDDALQPLLKGTPQEKQNQLAALRLHAPADESLTAIPLARAKLAESLKRLREGDRPGAKQAAVMAYLEGVEPIEPKLRARDSSLTFLLEEKMAAVRGAIDAGHPPETLETRIASANAVLSQCEEVLSRTEMSPTFAFWVAAGIFTREAFEAVLIIVTLLGVIRSVGSTQAAMYVHGGWMLAVLVGIVTWIFSGWLVAISGAQRELLEGSIAAFAVIVLLYFGFWLHRRTEIGKWRTFIDDMVKSAVDRKNLMALGLVAFMAVFREAFETVLFLRALLLESGPAQHAAVLGGVLSSFTLVVLLAGALVKYSVRIPIRQLFGISSVIMVLLSLILIGKAVHSFQETGLLSVTEFPLAIRVDLLGIYPTYQSVVPQAIVVAASLAYWIYGRRNSRLKEQAATSAT